MRPKKPPRLPWRRSDTGFQALSCCIIPCSECSCSESKMFYGLCVVLHQAECNQDWDKPQLIVKHIQNLNALITESQNHRIVGVGRDLCGSPSPTFLLKQGHLQQAVEDLVQVGLEYLQRRRLLTGTHGSTEPWKSSSTSRGLDPIW